MNQQLYRRCGCRDDNGKQIGAHCPKLKTDPKHRTLRYHLSHASDPKTSSNANTKRPGFPTKRGCSARCGSSQDLSRQGHIHRTQKEDVGGVRPRDPRWSTAGSSSSGVITIDSARCSSWLLT